MTNRQWLMNEMQNMSDEEFAHLAYDYICDNSKCKNGVKCMECKVNWLNEERDEHKEPIKLSDAERVILENIDKEYMWIARDDDGRLFIYCDMPVKPKGDNRWRGSYIEFVFNNLFQFIKWEDTEPYNIEELLKGK